MINALDLLFQAYVNILNTPHKTHRERQLMGNIYTQLCLFGGQPYRIKCEKAKVEYNRSTVVQNAPAASVLPETQVVEKKNPVRLEILESQPENSPLPPSQKEVVAEGKKRGPKPKVKE
jgi:hypothetical protein